MVISDDRRHALHNRLDHVLGPDEATTLMEYLPPVGWADMATRRDIDHLAAATKRDIDHLAAATKRDIDHLANRLDARIDHLAGRIDSLDDSVALRLEAMEHKIRGEFSDRLASHTRALALAITGNTAVVAMLAFAAANL